MLSFPAHRRHSLIAQQATFVLSARPRARQTCAVPASTVTFERQYAQTAVLGTLATSAATTAPPALVPARRDSFPHTREESSAPIAPQDTFVDSQDRRHQPRRLVLRVSTATLVRQCAPAALPVTSAMRLRRCQQRATGHVPVDDSETQQDSRPLPAQQRVRPADTVPGLAK